MQIERVSVKVGSRDGNLGEAFHDVLETKGFSHEEQKSFENLYH
jgi:hypothetical protein